MRRIFVALALMLVASSAFAQETMDETTLRQRMIVAEGKPPDSYIVISSSAGEYHVHKFRRGIDNREMYDIGPLHFEDGRFEGRSWDANPNGITTIHESASGRARPDRLKVTITRVEHPIDAWAYSRMNADGAGSIEYVDPQTWHVLKIDGITHSGSVETSFDDFRTIGAFTTPFHSKTISEVSGTHTEAKLVAFEARAVSDSDLAMPPTKPFVSFPAGTSSVELPTKFESAHIIVRVMVGNRGLDFILDTGAGGIYIDPNVVRELGLKTFDERSAVTAGRYNAALAVVPEMRIGSLEMHNVAVSTAPLGWEELGDVKAVGLLGYDFIRSVGLTIDYQHKRVTAVAAGNLTPPVMTPDSDILPIRLGSHQPMIDVAVNGLIAEQMVVDTGWSTEMALFSYFIRRYPEAFDKKVAFRFDPSVGYSGIGGGFKTNGYRLNTVDIGRYHLKDFDALEVVSPQSYEGTTDGVIGPGILQHFTVIFDYAGGKMYLVHNEGQ